MLLSLGIIFSYINESERYVSAIPSSCVIKVQKIQSYNTYCWLVISKRSFVAVAQCSEQILMTAFQLGIAFRIYRFNQGIYLIAGADLPERILSFCMRMCIIDTVIVYMNRSSNMNYFSWLILEIMGSPIVIYLT